MKMPLSFALMAVGIYLILPTPDELLIHPFIGFMLSHTFNVNLQTGIFWSCAVYISIGITFLATSIIVGGGVIICELNHMLSSGANNIIRGFDQKSGRVLHIMGEHAFNNIAEGEQILTSFMSDY